MIKTCQDSRPKSVTTPHLPPQLVLVAPNLVPFPIWRHAEFPQPIVVNHESKVSSALFNLET